MIVTIITVCRNEKINIVETINSVLMQDASDFEYIIQDGGSTDGTLTVINDFLEREDRASKIRIYSKSDGGIYDAMNSAVNKAVGDWILFLNAGDSFYSSDSLSRIISFIGEDVDFIYGDVNYVENDNNYIVEGKNIKTICKGLPFCHQCVLNKREWLKNNPYDLKYKICADYELYLRAYQSGNVFVHIPYTISNYLRGGFSEQHLELMINEMIEIRYKYGCIKTKGFYRLLYKVRGISGKCVRAIFPIKIINKLRRLMR